MRAIAMILLSMLLLAACSAAKPVDLTARYVREAPDGPILVKAAANGDARVEAGETVYLRKDGTDYVVLRDGQGSYAVRREDLLAVLAEGDSGLGPGPRAQPEYAVSPGAAETVAGVKGTVWKLHPKDVPSLATADAVIADDPSLANLGKALAMQASFAIARNSAGLGGPGNLEKAMIALFEKGAVLRFGSALRLERIDKSPIDASVFELPKPLLDRAALRQRVAAERARLTAPALR